MFKLIQNYGFGVILPTRFFPANVKLGSRFFVNLAFEDILHFVLHSRSEIKTDFFLFFSSNRVPTTGLPFLSAPGKNKNLLVFTFCCNGFITMNIDMRTRKKPLHNTYLTNTLRK